MYAIIYKLDNGVGRLCTSREFSSAGRASALQAEGHRFEPCNSHQRYAGIAQLVEQLICNQQVVGSSPITSSKKGTSIACPIIMGEFPSGQRGQTVNLLLSASVVRIHPLPPNLNRNFDTKLRFCFFARKAHNVGIFVKRKVSV